MADVKVRSGRVETELDPELVAALQPCAQMLLDVYLDRPAAQPVEKVAAQLTGPGPK
jgi:hypothetical protein